MMLRLVVVALILMGAFTLWACSSPAPKTPEPTVGQPQAEPVKEPPDVSADAKTGWVNFKDPSFAGSPNQLSCHSCHPYGGKDTSEDAMAKGTLIGAAMTFPKVVEMVGEEEISLVNMINFCITNPLEGEALADDDPLMEKMVIYHMALTPITFGDVSPVILSKCSGCHTGDNPTTGVNLADEATAVGKADKLRELVDAGKMPTTGTLTDMEFLTLLIWATTELDK